MVGGLGEHEMRRREKQAYQDKDPVFQGSFLSGHNFAQAYSAS